MKYDFDSYVERKHTNSVKWDGMKEFFGTDDALPMWVADMDFQSPQPVVEAIQKRAVHGVYGYTFNEELYSAFSKWLEKRHNWRVKREWLRTIPGVLPGLAAAILAFSDEDDEVILQPPVYYPFFRMVQGLNRKMVFNELNFSDGIYTMDLKDLKKKITSKTKLLVLCSPQNPTGRVWKKEELKELGKICAENDILILSDEIHADLVYKRYKHTPMATLYPQNTLVFMAPSKTFNIAGLGTAFAIVPNKKFFESLSQKLDSMGFGSGNVFGLTAAQAAYEKGEEWLDALLDYLEENLNFLKKFVSERMPIVKVVEPQGTYLVWLDFRNLGLNDEALKEFLLKKAKVAFDDGPIFGPGGEGFQRINIATPRSLLREGLERIEEALKTLEVEK